MNQGTNQILFALLRSAVYSEPLSEAERGLFSDVQLPALLETAKKHDMIHLLALGLKQNALAVEKQGELGRHILLAVYRQEQQRVELERLCRTLESAGIPFLPLKGAVLRGYYPEAWMRTSCDLDVLVREIDVDRAAALLVDECGYVLGDKGSHDVVLVAPNQTHIELHYDLVESGFANGAAEVLRHVWDLAQTRESGCCWYELTDEMFYFYHIAHMAKHFEIGGCGIKPLMDLWILDRIPAEDSERRDALLAQGGLLKFAQTVRKLSNVWFGNERHDDLTERTEQYILQGGVYGSAENYTAIQQQKKGGQLRYLLSQLFLPYELIKFQYPVLQKHRWLTPVMEVRRWFRLIFSSRVRRDAAYKLKCSNQISNEDAVAMQQFMDELGL